MPLIDHFHQPEQSLILWPSFHGTWLTMMLRWLNRTLPPRYRARSSVHFGRKVEADVAEFDTGLDGDIALTERAESNGAGVGVLLAPKTRVYAPPQPTATGRLIFPDELEIRIHDIEEPGSVVAVIELVSPSNKDRDESQRTFAAKCVAYLERGLGVIVVDIVSDRNGQLFERTLDLIHLPLANVTTAPSEMHAIAYRPIVRQQVGQVEIWWHPLTFGQPLPTLPLWLRRGGVYPVDLETTYTEAREIEGY